MASSSLGTHAVPRESSRQIASAAPLSSSLLSSHLLDLWHLLSLDAPTVAMLWTWTIARSNGISLPASSILAMGVAVWILYAADRLLDSRVLDSRVLDLPTSPRHKLPGRRRVPCHPAEIEERHRFHHRHRRRFLCALLLASAVLGALLPRLARPSLRLDLLLGALLFAWFAIIHAAHDSARRRVPKELGVGIFFSAATFIPTVALRPDLRAPLLPVAILFAALCSLNCLFIYTWEHPCASEAHPSTQFGLRHLRVLAIGIAAAAAVLRIFDPRAPALVLLSCAASALLLLLLDQNRRRLARTTLRASADLTLLSPLLLLAAALR